MFLSGLFAAHASCTDWSWPVPSILVSCSSYRCQSPPTQSAFMADLPNESPRQRTELPTQFHLLCTMFTFSLSTGDGLEVRMFLPRLLFCGGCLC